MKAKITDAVNPHPRVLKNHFIELDDAAWEVSSVRLIEDPENIREAASVLTDIIYGIKWKYETMIFKVIEEEGEWVREPGGWKAYSYGYYRSNQSDDVVKAHDQIVSLIAEGKLIPLRDEGNLQISTHIVKAMTKESRLIDEDLDKEA